LESLYHSENR